MTDEFGSKYDNGLWTGILSLVYSGVVDIGIGDFTVTKERFKFDVILTVHRRLYVEIKWQLDATEVFITDLIACSTCFGDHYAEGYVSGLQDAAGSCKPDT